MKILFVTSEAAPFVKVGGLGDVAGSLPRAISSKTNQIAVILPLYDVIDQSYREKMTFVRYIYVKLAWRSLYCGLFRLEREGVTYYFIDNEYYFKRSEVYGQFDDGERFAFFSKAVIELLPELEWMPDVLHCNDWQSALVPLYLKEAARWESRYQKVKTLFTIHNIRYQGRFSRETLTDVFGLPIDLYNNGTLEFMGGINLMKGAIERADAVTTVSPTYANELQYGFYAQGLEGVIAANKHKITGILNGIDTDVYNPQTDPNLIRHYSPDNLEGKTGNKLELQRLLGLDQNRDMPLVAMVSRLVSDKGLDLVAASLDVMMDLDIQFVLLGRGEWHYEQRFAAAQQLYPSRLSANIMFSFDLANKIYAGADIFLMPSQIEPCGLAQMIAMRYGTVPLVRETGGLQDTVKPYDPKSGEGNGFTFANYNAGDMMYVLHEAVGHYADRTLWQTLQRRCMEVDVSWNDKAHQYVALYKTLLKAK